MKLLDKEISNFMNLDHKELAKEMNNAFEGKKETW
jgi:hypothetical protein